MIKAIRYSGKPLESVISLESYIAQEKRLDRLFFYASTKHAINGNTNKANLARHFSQVHHENWRNVLHMSDRQFRSYYRDYLRELRFYRDMLYPSPKVQTVLF